ncbi:MAG: ribonuclease H family protein [Bacteroidales bacterium]|nr:ribonuclease H family protein [Bacteroidales bacterium]
MAKAKNKYYVVWKGIQPGIYNNWEECKKNVEGFAGPQYKSFSTLEEAEKAYAQKAEEHIGKRTSAMQPILDSLYGAPVTPSISVDGAHSSATRLSEYRGVDTASKIILFHQGPFMDGTNNVMEFLALVHALAMCTRQKTSLPVYSDSVNAIKWVKNKKCGTKLKPTAHNQILFDLIARAEKWLHTHTYTNPVLKWETHAWGEIPADFGRK